MSKRGKVWLTGLVLAAAALRYRGLFANTFHADEALFASWSRLIAVWRDPLLLSQTVDKPPLLFYLQALFYPLVGSVEWAARMPAFIASMMLIPIAGMLAWRLFGDELTAVVAAAFVTFSPLAIQYSATAFTDPLLTMLLAAALAVAAKCSGRPGPGTAGPGNGMAARAVAGPCLGAGILFGLAVMTKYQAWLFLPLVVGLGVFYGWRWREWRSWLLGLAPLVILLLIWDLARGGGISLFDQQLASYGGLRVTWSWELWPRLEAWGREWSYLLGSPVLFFIIIISMPLFLWQLIHEKDRSTAIELGLVLFLIGYFVLHWLLAVPVWDRYILPLVPLVGLVLGRFVWRVSTFTLPSTPSLAPLRSLNRRLVWFVLLILLAFQAPSVISAYQGRLPVGGQPSADSGAALIARELYDAPYGTVLYDHWFSWQWRYHLFDRRVYVSWFPDPDELAGDLTVFGREEGLRYLALPETPAAEPVKRAVAEAGFKLSLVKSANLPDGRPGMTLYRLKAQ